MKILKKILLLVPANSASGGIKNYFQVLENKFNLPIELCSSRFFLKDFRDFLRKKIHPNYTRESLSRKKFIVQNLIPKLENDWKVLIYGNKYYVLKRYVRDNDFRASDSGKFVFEEDLPKGFLDYCMHVFKKLGVPNLSIDVGYDGENLFIIELQAIYFGTYTIEESPFCYENTGQDWKLVRGKSILEEEYARSVVDFINTQYE